MAELERLLAVEQELTQQQTTLSTLKQTMKEVLDAVQSLASPAASQNTSGAPSAQPLPVAKSSSSTRLKPATPTEFDGSRDKGRAFLNSCDLYIGLVPDQFANDEAKIYWALSFMKAGRAALFADRTIRTHSKTGSVPFASWGDFRDTFVKEFCPKNEVQTARMKLEGTRYHQGSRSVEAYLDEFRELVDRAEYVEGGNVVLKFRHGLSADIQRQIAILTTGRPGDDDAEAWYAAALSADENRVANEAFQSSQRVVKPPAPTSTPKSTSVFPMPQRTFPFAPSSSVPKPATTSAIPRPPAPVPKDSSAMEVDATRAKGGAGNCYRCGKTGHMARDCPDRFDVRHMTLEELEGALEDALVKKDVEEVEEKEDF